MPTETTSDPRIHCENIRHEIEDLIAHAHHDMERVNDPGFHALLEITTEILGGLRTAYVHYGENQRPAERLRR